MCSEGVSESVEEEVHMTDEEVSKNIVVKITNPILLDALINPIRGALRDPLMGPLEDDKRKKEIFCHNMMGKRINHGCRSVISPDPYLAVNEIEGVNSFWNAIVNGPEVHPVANKYIDKMSSVYLRPGDKKSVAAKKQLPFSSRPIMCNERGGDYDYEVKVFYGHLVKGGILLCDRQGVSEKEVRFSFITDEEVRKHSFGAIMCNERDYEVKVFYGHFLEGTIFRVNRQPMTHAVIILREKRFLPMRFTNCSELICEFDGDEMNHTLPQSEILRARL